jgi:NAD(P)H-dependent FMN reductase
VSASRVLVVHHTVSPSLQTMLDMVLQGLTLAHVDAVARPALVCSAVEVLEADAVIVGGPVNIGMMAGAVKHFFDQIYYPCLDATVGRPFGLYLHGNDDAAGALRDLGKIVTGLRWKQVTDHVVCTGPITHQHADWLENLGGTVGLAVAGDD